LYRRNDGHEKLEIKSCADGSQMHRVWWDWISAGRAASPGRTQNLPSAVQAVFWQGPHKFGVDDPAHAPFREKPTE
jgi:hypothetical protein